MLRSAPYWRTVFTGVPAPDAKRALVDRFLRIAPAYYVALTATLLAVFAIQGGMVDALPRILAGYAFLSWAHPATFFPADLNGPLWYVAFDVTGGLAVIAVMGMVVKMPKKWAWTGLVGAAAVLLAGHYAFMSLPFPPGEGPVAVWFPTYNPFLFGLHFLLGMAVGGIAIRAEISKLKHSYWFDAAFVLSIAAAFLFLWNIREADDFSASWPTGPYRFPIVPLLLASALLTVAYTKKIGGWLDNRLFAWIAGVSYSAYLYHALVIAILRRTYFTGDAVAVPDWFALVAIAVPTAFAIAYLSNRYVEMKAVIWYRKHMEKRDAERLGKTGE